MEWHSHQIRTAIALAENQTRKQTCQAPNTKYKLPDYQLPDYQISLTVPLLCWFRVLLQPRRQFRLQSRTHLDARIDVLKRLLQRALRCWNLVLSEETLHVVPHLHAAKLPRRTHDLRPAGHG